MKTDSKPHTHLRVRGENPTGCGGVSITFDQ